MTAVIGATMAGFVGATLGSIANLISYRIPRGLSLRPKPNCPGCKTSLLPRDYLPVVSWFLLRGRCRGCNHAIPSRYPVTEVVTALLSIAAILVLGPTIEGLMGVVLIFVLVSATVIDLEFRIIPNKLTFAGAAAAVALVATTGFDPLISHLLAGLIAGIALFIPAIIFPAGMGMGDVKLAAVMGLFLGSAVAPALFVAMVAGSLFGIGVMLSKGAKEGRKIGIPFGPFLALGGVVALFYGNELLNFYLHSGG